MPAGFACSRYASCEDFVSVKSVLATDKQHLWFSNIGPRHTCSQNGNIQFLQFLLIFCDDHVECVHTTFQDTYFMETVVRNIYYVPYFFE